MDLNAPLGMDPAPRPRRRRAWMGAAAAAAVALAGAVGYLASIGKDAKAPTVVAAIPPQIVEPVPKAPSAPAAPLDATATGSVAPPANRQDTASSGTTMENGVKVIRRAPSAEGGAASVQAQGPLIIDVTRALDGGHHAATPPTAAEPQTTPVPGDARTPRIAIFVEGMGLGATATRTALETMPAAVDLAFVPYGAAVAASVASAKAKGHEVLLQLPMENGRGGSLGPHMLRPDEPAAAFDADMTWLTGQFSGYAGMANLLGAPVTANASTMTAVLKAVGTRGLFYVDDATSRRSLATSLAAGLGVPVLKADIVLDATSDEDAVRANLAGLVALARAKGTAIGMATGLPDHLATIAKFAGELGSRGVTLVPLSEFARRPVTTATAR